MQHSDSQPQDQELHVSPSEPVTHPMAQMILKLSSVKLFQWQICPNLYIVYQRTAKQGKFLSLFYVVSITLIPKPDMDNMIAQSYLCTQMQNISKTNPGVYLNIIVSTGLRYSSDNTYPKLVADSTDIKAQSPTRLPLL